MSKNLKKSVPRLRFPEFKDDWEQVTIEEIASVSSGGTPSRSEPSFWNGDIPWVTTSEIGQCEIYESAEKITKKGLENSSAKLFKKDTILLAMYGQGKTRGQVSILKIEATTNQACAAITLKSNYNPEFIYYFLFKEYEQLRLLSNDGSQKNLSAGLIKQYIVPKTLIAEQEKIASFLGSIDTRLTQLRRRHELLQTYKQGVMQKIFSQELRFKDATGSDFPDWEEIPMGEIFDFYRGGSLSKSDLDNDGKNSCIHYGQLFTIYKEVIQSVESRTNMQNGFKSRFGDILMPSSDVTPIGLATASVLLKENVILGGDMNILRPKKLVNSIYFSYLLNFEKKKIIELVSGITVRHIYGKDLRKLVLCIPTSSEEQDRIAIFLTTINKKIEAVAQQIDRTEQFKKGLLQKMFV
jgi:type I restriction enzyme, S subunit